MGNLEIMFLMTLAPYDLDPMWSLCNTKVAAEDLNYPQIAFFAHV